MYALTENPEIVKCLETGALIPHEGWMREAYEAWLAEGNTPQPYIPYEIYSAEHFNHIRSEAWKWMTGVVQARRYDDIATCCSYYNSSVPRYSAEARAMVAWRDDVNLALEQLVTTLPPGVTTWEQVQPLLPQPEAYDWPAAVELPLDSVPPIQIPVE